jgi:GR25 family glycosyltransferase involved in LPS biosynthesis
MKANVITILDDNNSVAGSDHLIESSKKVLNDFDIKLFEASTLKTIKSEMSFHQLNWNYPWNGQEIIDFATGLTKTGYQTAVPEKRIACFMSHYRLWLECITHEEDFLIFEHDALFTRKLNLNALESSNKSVVALNRPQRGATPRADLYQQKIQESASAPIGSRTPPDTVVGVPYIRSQAHPAGLPGNSAYYLRPSGAKKLVSLVHDYGAWPNDAIMCRQLMPGMLGCLYPASTTVQVNESSTTR